MIFSIEQLRSLKDKDLRKEGVLVAEGRFLTERYLASGWRVSMVFCAENIEGLMRPLVSSYERRTGWPCAVHIATGEEMENISGYPFHRGVLAAGPRPKLSALEDFLQTHHDARRIVVCPDLTDTENVGTIIRSAAAFGFDAFIAGEKCADPLSRRVLRVSMGGVFSLPIVAAAGGTAKSGTAVSRGTEEAGEAAAAANLLKSAGFTIIGAAAPASSSAPAASIAPAASATAAASLSPTTLSPVPLADFAPPEKTAILFGGEGYGIPEDWAAVCDSFITIPMGVAKPGTPDSLNVGVAAGIIMYHFMYNLSSRPDSRRLLYHPPG